MAARPRALARAAGGGLPQAESGAVVHAVVPAEVSCSLAMAAHPFGWVNTGTGEACGIAAQIRH